MGPGGYRLRQCRCTVLFACAFPIYVLVVCGFTAFGHPNTKGYLTDNGLLPGLSYGIVILGGGVAVGATLIVGYCVVCATLHDTEGGPLRPLDVHAPQLALAPAASTAVTALVQ